MGTRGHGWCRASWAPLASSVDTGPPPLSWGSWRGAGLGHRSVFLALPPLSFPAHACPIRAVGLFCQQHSPLLSGKWPPGPLRWWQSLQGPRRPPSVGLPGDNLQTTFPRAGAHKGSSRHNSGGRCGSGRAGADLAARGQAGPMGPLCRRPAGRPLLPFSQGPPDSALKAGQVGQRCQSRPATRWPGDPSSPRCEPRTERPGFLCHWSLRRGFWGLPRMALGPSSSRTQADFPCTQTDCRDRGRRAWPDHRVLRLIGLSHVPHRQSWPSPAVWAAPEPGRPRSLGSSVASALPAETTFGELSSLTSAWPRAARVPCAQPLPLERLRGGRGPSPAEGGRIPGTRPSGGSPASFCNPNGLLIF